jgi:hypothetical protein
MPASSVPKVSRGRTRLSLVVRQSGDLISVGNVTAALSISRLEAAKLLARWNAQGWIKRLSRGTYCGVRRFDNENEKLRLYIATHFSNKVYRIELFFKQTEKLGKNSELGTALINKYGSNIEVFNMGLIKTIWAWNGMSSGASLGAVCGLQDGVGGIGTCSLRLANERLQKQEEDAQARERAGRAPPPPKF